MDHVVRDPGWVVVREVDGPDAIVAVARDAGGGMVGFASAGPTRDADAPTPWELYTVDVVPSAYGTGLAQRLVADVLADRTTTVWAWCENGPALRFYAKAGFTPDGARRVHEDSGRAEMRLLRR